MKRLLLVFLVLTSITLSASNESNFPLGVYSHLGNKEFVYDNKDLFVAWMDSLSYNTNIMELFPVVNQFDGYVYPESDFVNLLGQMDGAGIDAIVTDRCWTIDFPYSAHSLTKSNFVQLEAEFKGESYPDGFTTVNPNLADLYWYGSSYVKEDETGNPLLYPIHSQNRVGYSYTDIDASKKYTWICHPDSTDIGYAYADLQSRWDVSANNYPLVNGLFRVQRPIGNLTDNNCFNITYRVKMENIPTMPPDTPLLYFRIIGYTCTNQVWNAPIPVTPIHVTTDTPVGPYTIQNGVFKYSDYLSIGSPIIYFDVTAKVTYQQLVNLGLMGNYNIASLNPRLFWYGNNKLSLDYITIEDSQYRQIDQADASFRTAVKNRVDHIADLSTNVEAIMTFDEPTQAQFSAYRVIQEMITGSSVLPMTAVNRRGSNFAISQNQTYNHYAVFKQQIAPKILMPDPYPVVGNVDWSTNTPDDGHLQQELDSMVRDVYDFVSRKCNADTLFYPVVQAFGSWDGNQFKWSDSFMRPPKATQKMLQFLPLCFGANGIFNYRLYGLHALDGSGDYCALYTNFVSTDPRMYSQPYVDHDTFDALKECNPRVRKYGELLNESGVVWNLAAVLADTGIDAVNVEYPVNLSNYMLSEIHLGPETSAYYKGFIQMGFYTDAADNPYFMLVNRRSNYFDGNLGIPAANLVPPNSNYQRYFPEFPDQAVRFVPNEASHNTYGTHVAMYDPFDNAIYPTQGGEINAQIGPGDGILLHMCSSLPASVTDNAVIKTLSYLSGTITIEDSTIVSILPGTDTTMLPGSSITVKRGSALNLSGDLNIGANVVISVEEGASICFDDASCHWGQGSKLLVSGGTLSISGGAWDKADNTMSWSGIRISDSNLVTISNTTIADADYHLVNNSNLLISNSSFNIPANSWGLLLKNSITGYQTEIINTEPGRGFYGTSSLTSKGIYLYTMKNPAYISNVDFQNLNYGIFKSAIPYATDSISECNFVNCDTGIRLCNNENGTDIEQCSFANNQTGKQGTGIQLVASSPTISASNFTGLYRGVLTEYTLLGGLGINSGINESNFYNCDIGIESRNATHRLKTNYFNRNNSGIVNHAGSNMNLSYGAQNVLMNNTANIVFHDTMPYESTIQLFTGHNNFYRLLDNSTGLSAIDFSFDTNYYNFPVTLDFKINASKNWFQDDQVTCNNPAYVDYVYVDLFDPSPTMPAPPPESDRLFIALGYESQESYEQAGEIYKDIIEDQLVEEETYITSAIDGLYRCTMMIPDPSWELTDYFDTKALQYAIDYPSLSSILKDYLAKVFVLDKDFQAAVDLIQLRIDNPISEIDSLRAVLDLEIVLQLAAMEEDKRPLTTKYAQYQYPDIQIFDVMHSNNWDRYNRVLHQNDPENESNIAPVPLIQSNYPNPFNPSTTIAFSIPETGRARVSVYNIKGQKVKDLLNTEMTRGTHRLVWDGRDTNNRNVSSGIYFFKLESGGKTSVRKAMLIK